MQQQQEEEKFGIDEVQFDLEKDFSDVLQELAADQSLERFRQEYERLHKLLRASHENEKRLLSKCRELNQDITQTAEKVQSAIQMSQSDNQKISYLKQELDKTIRLLELSKDREEKSKQRIDHLHGEISNLHAIIDKANQTQSGPAITVHDLIQVTEELKKEKELLTTMAKNVLEDIQQTSERLNASEGEKNKLKTEMDTFVTKKEELEKQVENSEENKKKRQSELEDIKKNLDEQKKKNQVQEEEKVKLEREKREKMKLKDENENKRKKLDNDYQINSKEIKKKKKTYQQLLAQNDKIRQDLEINEQKYEILLREKEEKEQHLLKLRKLLERLDSELGELENEKFLNEKIKILTQQGINQLENDINEEKRLGQEDRQTLGELRRNRDVLQKEIDRSETNNRRQNEELIAKEKLFKEKGNELSGIKKEIERLNNQKKNLEKEKEKYGIQAAQANAKYFHSLEEIKLKDNLISEFQKKNIETEAKLKQQLNLYEAVRSDRNLYSKKLTETQEEIGEIKRRYKIMNYQISQLKEEIDTKENELNREHFEHKKKDKTIEEHDKVTKKYQKDIKEKEEKIKTYISEIAKLHFMIKESEQQRQKLKEEYELVVAERDILGTQLIRRNAEARLLYEKIKINQSTLKKGEIQYAERLGDIITLKGQIADLINEIKIYKSQANSISDIKMEIHNLAKELIEEKLRVKALSEELENPMNVHRWRKLEATDSETYELMTKIQSLQKRLIQKTEEVMEKEKVVQSKDFSLKELKDIMKRQPGIEDEKMIPTYQDSLKQKTKQLRAMNNELGQYQSHLSEYKIEIDRINKELQETKKRYFEQKKREQQKLEQSQQQQKALAIPINLPDKRFTGGGFNLAYYS